MQRLRKEIMSISEEEGSESGVFIMLCIYHKAGFISWFSTPPKHIHSPVQIHINQAHKIDLQNRYHELLTYDERQSSWDWNVLISAGS